MAVTIFTFIGIAYVTYLFVYPFLDWLEGNR